MVTFMVIKHTTKQNIEDLKKKLLPILRRYCVSRAGVFGSIAEGTANETSDIDLLIEFNGEKSLFDLIGLKLDLEMEINKQIDILTYNAINPLIKERVLAQEVKIL